MFLSVKVVGIFWIEMEYIIISPLKVMEVFFPPLNGFLLSNRVFRNELVIIQETGA